MRVDVKHVAGIARALRADVKHFAGIAVDYIIKNSMLRRTLDNVTVLVVAFKSLKTTIFGEGELPVL